MQANADLGRGYIVSHAISAAKATGQKAVRVDVLKGNLPAVKLYESLGFKFIGEVELFYEDTGLTEFLLYEYLI